MQAQIRRQLLGSLLLSHGRGGGREALIGRGHARHPPLAAAAHDCSRAVIQIKNDVIVFLFKSVLQVFLGEFHLIRR